MPSLAVGWDEGAERRAWLGGWREQEGEEGEDFSQRADGGVTAH